MLNFDLETKTEGSNTLVRIRGDFDLQVGERVADALTEIESAEPDLLVVDLSRVSFMDSTGMGVIAAAHLRAVDAGRRFVIVSPPAGVRQAFEISGLQEVITVVNDISELEGTPFGT
jgi:anti-sigma B factor antagonist